jgi:hypothetical protein
LRQRGRWRTRDDTPAWLPSGWGWPRPVPKLAGAFVWAREAGRKNKCTKDERADSQSANYPERKPNSDKITRGRWEKRAPAVTGAPIAFPPMRAIGAPQNAARAWGVPTPTKRRSGGGCGVGIGWRGAGGNLVYQLAMVQFNFTPIHSGDLTDYRNLLV